MRSSEAADPGLHTGLAYLVKNEPYTEHILKYASQQDVSTPIPQFPIVSRLTLGEDQHM